MNTPADNQSEEIEAEPEVPPATDPNPGEPIAGLAELALTTSSGFEAGVRRRIRRRLVAAQVVGTPAKVAASMMQRLVIDLVRAVHTLGHRDGKPPDRPAQQ